MLGSVLARSRAFAACAALAAGVAGCAAPSASKVTAPGSTLTIYASLPPGAGGDQRTQDVLDAEQLALGQAGTKVDRFTIRFGTLQGKEVSANARTAIQDASTVAYLGEVIPGASGDSIGITNAQGVLEVSPTDTAQALTQSVAAVPHSPGVYYEALGTYGHTFARVVPTTFKEAGALLHEMQALHVSKLYVRDDGSDYGKALAGAIKYRASPITVLSTQTGADAVFYATADQSAAARVFNEAVAANPTVKLFGPSALGDQAFAAALSPNAQRSVYISSPGFLNRDLPPEGRKFASDFKATYQHSPAPEAIFGYEAMAAVVAVLRQAGSSANNRATVVHDFLASKRSSSVLGGYQINSSGDTTLGPFVISRIKGGQLIPYASFQQPG